VLGSGEDVLLGLSSSGDRRSSQARICQDAASQPDKSRKENEGLQGTWLSGSSRGVRSRQALEQMKPMPMPDEAEVAARAAREVEREAKAEVKRAAARAAKEQGERDDREKARTAEANVLPARTEMEKKEARDARYAARKSRNSGRS
jgi:hypothetical protein